MPTPSIVIVPARLKAATLFSQLPLTGEADLSLVQASGNATRVNASGLIEVPRTNLHTHSEAFASNYTQVLNLSASGTNLTAPDNSATADRYFETTANEVHIIAIAAGGGFALTSGTVYTFSTFAQSVGGRNLRLILTAGGSIDVLYTLSGSGTVSNTSVATIQNFGNGWYRCTYTFTATSSVNFRQNVYSVSGTTNSFAGDVTKGFIVWGAQLQIGNTATTYIPTTSSIRTLFAGVAQDGALSPNVPRLDYRNLVGAVDCPALLVEPSAANTALQSAGFEVSGTWAPTNISVTTGTTSAFIAPDGSTDADLLADNSTNGRHRVQQNLLSFTSGTTYTFSVFVKKNSSNRFLLINANTAFNSVAALSLDTLAITNISGSGASVENYGNGWYRFSIRGTASTTTTGGTVFVQMQDTNADGTYIGNGSSFYLWGAQLEVGSVATSYIPTTTASATRGADNYSVSGAVSGFIGLSSGAIYAEVDVRNWEASGRVVALSDGTSDGSIVIMENANRSFSLVVNVAGSSEVNITTASGLYNGLHRIAIAYKKDDYAVYLNGQLAGTDTSAGVPSVNRIFVGKIESSGTTNYFNDRIRAIAFYNTRPTNSELATLTQVDYTNLVWDTYTSRTSLSTELPECLFVRHIELLNT
jgi:hypothetical protein